MLSGKTTLSYPAPVKVTMLPSVQQMISTSGFVKSIPVLGIVDLGKEKSAAGKISWIMLMNSFFKVVES